MSRASGQNPGLRGWLAAHEMPYVLATRNDEQCRWSRGSQCSR